MKKGAGLRLNQSLGPQSKFVAIHEHEIRPVLVGINRLGLAVHFGRCLWAIAFVCFLISTRQMAAVWLGVTATNDN